MRRPFGSSGADEEHTAREIRAMYARVFGMIKHFNSPSAMDEGDFSLFMLDGIIYSVFAMFSAEEAAMRKGADRGLESRRCVHRRIIGELRELRAMLGSGVRLSPMESAHGLDSLIAYFLVHDPFAST